MRTYTSRKDLDMITYYVTGVSLDEINAIIKCLEDKTARLATHSVADIKDYAILKSTTGEVIASSEHAFLPTSSDGFLEVKYYWDINFSSIEK